MRVQKHWMDEENVFDVVTEALEDWSDAAEHWDFRCGTDEDRYGMLGWIYIDMNGKRYSLALNEEL